MHVYSGCITLDGREKGSAGEHPSTCFRPPHSTSLWGIFFAKVRPLTSLLKSHKIMPMSNRKFLLTKEGLEKLNEELRVLVNEKRKDVIERIQEAVAHGDLSENADYAQAKEEQSFIEGRIQEIEDMIKNAEIIDTTTKHTAVTIGSTITVGVYDGSGSANERKYTIVGSNEANPAEGKISNESLVGKALLGRKVGEKVPVQTAAGEMHYEIKNIE